MVDEIQGKINRTMEQPPAYGARLPRWAAAALLSAGMALPTAGCWDSVGPSAVYAGPPVREPETRPQPPPEEPEAKKDEVAAPVEPPRPEDDVRPLYGVP